VGTRKKEARRGGERKRRMKVRAGRGEVIFVG